MDKFGHGELNVGWIPKKLDGFAARVCGERLVYDSTLQEPSEEVHFQEVISGLVGLGQAAVMRT